MPDIGEVDPDLVGAARLEPDLHQGGIGGDGDSLEFGDGLLAVGDHGHLLSVSGISSDRGLDPGRRLGDLPNDDGAILARHAAALKLAGELAVGRIISGDHHETGGVAIEPVDDARTLGATDRRPAGTPAE